MRRAFRTVLAGAAADRAQARFLDEDRPRRPRVVDGSRLPRGAFAPFADYAEVAAFLDAPYGTGCTERGCDGAALRGGQVDADSGRPGAFSQQSPDFADLLDADPKVALLTGAVAAAVGSGSGFTRPADDVPIDLYTPPVGPDVRDLPPAHQAVDRPCSGVGTPLEPPPWQPTTPTSAVPAAYTKWCFISQYGIIGWPPHSCRPPCVFPQPAVLPTADEATAALDSLAPRVAGGVHEAQVGALNQAVAGHPALVVVDGGTQPLPSNWALLGRSLTPNEVDLLGAAVWILQQNIDVVEWAVCLACTWSPFIDDADVDTVVQAVVDGFLGLADRRIYVVAGLGGGATGGGSPAVTVGTQGTMQDGRTGPVIPIELGVYQAAAGTVAGALPATSVAGRMCAAAWVAETLIHEMVHICAQEPTLSECTEYPPKPGCPRPGAANDLYTCWAVQNMSSISFLWALGQRFPTLRGLACCPKTADTYFMTSEPDDIQEPFPWVSTVPC